MILFGRPIWVSGESLQKLLKWSKLVSGQWCVCVRTLGIVKCKNGLCNFFLPPQLNRMLKEQDLLWKRWVYAKMGISTAGTHRYKFFVCVGWANQAGSHHLFLGWLRGSFPAVQSLHRGWGWADWAQTPGGIRGDCWHSLTLKECGLPARKWAKPAAQHSVIGVSQAERNKNYNQYQ